MPKYQVIIEPKAKENLEELFEFYDLQKPVKGSNFLVVFVDFMEIIEENPARWQFLHTREAGIRRAIIFNSQVIVLYKIIDTTIYISDILDSRSNWKKE